MKEEKSKKLKSKRNWATPKTKPDDAHRALS